MDYFKYEDPLLFLKNEKAAEYCKLEVNFVYIRLREWDLMLFSRTAATYVLCYSGVISGSSAINTKVNRERVSDYQLHSFLKKQPLFSISYILQHPLTNNKLSRGEGHVQITTYLKPVQIYHPVVSSILTMVVASPDNKTRMTTV